MGKSIRPVTVGVNPLWIGMDWNILHLTIFWLYQCTNLVFSQEVIDPLVGMHVLVMIAKMFASVMLPI
jgi:hypothetical protein